LIRACFIIPKDTCPSAAISEKRNHFMKTTRRLVLGILLGAICGAALTGGIIFALPENYNLHSYNTESFVYFIQFVFGRLATNLTAFLIGVGALIGVVTGLFVARVVPHPKICLGILFAFMVGIAVGGAALYFPGKNVFKFSSALYENMASTERGFAYLSALRSLDRGATNQMYITMFQERGRMALTNYLREAEQQMQRVQNLKNKEQFDTDFFFTNSPTYRMVQKYLATH
jgi:hypothetical protein